MMMLQMLLFYTVGLIICCLYCVSTTIDYFKQREKGDREFLMEIKR